jgi:hypothetical protein
MMRRGTWRLPLSPARPRVSPASSGTATRRATAGNRAADCCEYVTFKVLDDKERASSSARCRSGIEDPFEGVADQREREHGTR